MRDRVYRSQGDTETENLFISSRLFPDVYTAAKDKGQVYISACPFNMVGHVYINDLVKDGDRRQELGHIGTGNVTFIGDAVQEYGLYTSDLQEACPIISQPEKTAEALSKEKIETLDWFLADPNSSIALLKLIEVAADASDTKSDTKGVYTIFKQTDEGYEEFLKYVFDDSPRDISRRLVVLAAIKSFVSNTSDNTSDTLPDTYWKLDNMNTKQQETDFGSLPNVTKWSLDVWIRNGMADWFLPTDPRKATWIGDKWDSFITCISTYIPDLRNPHENDDIIRGLQWFTKMLSNKVTSRSTNDILNFVAYAFGMERSNRSGDANEDIRSGREMGKKIVELAEWIGRNDAGLKTLNYFQYIYHDGEPDDWVAVLLNRRIAKAKDVAPPIEIVVRVIPLGATKSTDPSVIDVYVPWMDFDNFHNSKSAYKWVVLDKPELLKNNAQFMTKFTDMPTVSTRPHDTRISIDPSSSDAILVLIYALLNRRAFRVNNVNTFVMYHTLSTAMYICDAFPGRFTRHTHTIGGKPRNFDATEEKRIYAWIPYDVEFSNDCICVAPPNINVSAIDELLQKGMKHQGTTKMITTCRRLLYTYIIWKTANGRHMKNDEIAKLFKTYQYEFPILGRPPLAVQRMMREETLGKYDTFLLLSNNTRNVTEGNPSVRYISLHIIKADVNVKRCIDWMKDNSVVSLYIVCRMYNIDNRHNIYDSIHLTGGSSEYTHKWHTLTGKQLGGKKPPNAIWDTINQFEGSR